MPTIKDVAKLAGVSCGTVSNVINNVKTVSLENVKKVEEAMNSLGYRPQTSARNLKASTSKTVSVVLPNITDKIYARFFTDISRLLQEIGFYPELYITDDIPTNEKAMIMEILSSSPAGLIISSCRPWDKKLFTDVLEKVPNTVFFGRQCSITSSFVGFDDRRSITTAVTKLLQAGIDDAVLLCGPDIFSSQQECIEGFSAAYIAAGKPVPADRIISANFTLESAFRAAVRLINSGKKPSTIISTSSIITDGIQQMIRYTCPDDPPRIITLGDVIWKNATAFGNQTIPKPVFEAARTIARMIEAGVRNGPFNDKYEIHLKNGDPISIVKGDTDYSHKSLRVLTLKGDISAALITVLPYIRERCGLDVLIDAVPYEELYRTIYEHSSDDYYDVYIFDVPWIHDLAENGILKDLSGLLTREVLNRISVEARTFDNFAFHGKTIYALPFLFTSQLLFYRKDLFEDYKNGILFQQQYGAPLDPPKTWAEFNAVARFFTQKYNPNSPTQYGTTLGGKFSSAAHVEYTTRLWSYQGNVFDDDGRLILNTINARLALENYAESYKYASPESIEHWWYEQVEEFAAGKTAMMIMYSSHAAPIVDRNTSKILGKIGYAGVPGKKHTFGGWSAGISAKSRSSNEALMFIETICGKELATPLTLLGCFSANHENFVSNISNSVYPWTSDSIEAYEHSILRMLPEGKQNRSYKQYEQIIASAVRSCITGELSAEDALYKASCEIEAFLKD